jgi:hypothetical protein
MVKSHVILYKVIELIKTGIIALNQSHVSNLAMYKSQVNVFYVNLAKYDKSVKWTSQCEYFIQGSLRTKLF